MLLSWQHCASPFLQLRVTWYCDQASRALKNTVKPAARFFFCCACNRALMVRVLSAVKMHVKKLPYRRFLYTWATGQTENSCCVNRALIKLLPLKGICVNFDSPKHIYTHTHTHTLATLLGTNLYPLHCPLSGHVLTYISLLIIPCMIVYVTNNKEPRTSRYTLLVPGWTLQN